MGFTNRFSTLLKQKVNTLLNKYEDPKEALDYSYVRQVETLNRLRRNIVEVVTAKKRLEMQKMKLWDNVRTLDEQAQRAVESNREDLAKLALVRKNANLLQMQGLDKQITETQETEFGVVSSFDLEFSEITTENISYCKELITIELLLQSSIFRCCA